MSVQQINLSPKQARALKVLLNKVLPESVDAAINDYGMDTAFMLFTLRRKFNESPVLATTGDTDRD